MPSVYIRSLFALKNDISDKVWGAQVLQDGGYYQYISVWGKRGTKLQHTRKPATVLGAAALKEFAQACNKKEYEGYVGTNDPGLLFAMTDFAAMPLVLPPSKSIASVPAKSSSCGFCGLMGTDYAEAFAEAKCTICGKQALDHTSAHPHSNPYNTACAQFSLKPHQWENYGWKLPGGLIGSPAKTSSIPSTKTKILNLSGPQDPSCINCQVNKLVPLKHRKQFYEQRCGKCGCQLAAHAFEHPHVYGGTCSKAVFTDTARNVAQKAIEPPSQFVLPDLPCNCSHTLSSHAEGGTKTPSGIQLSDRYCLLVTCKCEAYRRTCAECGLTTISEPRHTASCMSGLRERLALEPTDPSVRKPRHFRLQRQISHMILPDED